MAAATARRKTTSDIAAILEDERAAYEEEARLDEELAATVREVEELRLSLGSAFRIACATRPWLKRARQRAVTLGIRPMCEAARDASPSSQLTHMPEPEPEPELEWPQLPVHIVPLDEEDDESDDRPDWALSSERSSARDLIEESFDLGKDLVEQGQVEAVYENQRRSLLGDFSAKNLLSGTRGQWSNITGNTAQRGRLPHGWHWAVEHRQGETDPDGWEYAFHFRASWFAEPHREGTFGGDAWVRRRKWVPAQNVRTAVPLKLTTPAHDVDAGRRPAPSYCCILEVWEARSLSCVSDGVPVRDDAQAKPPSAVFRIRVGDQFHQSAARPQSNNPHWGDETNSERCRRPFRVAPPADVLAEVEEDDLARLARNFAGRYGVKVRDRTYLPTFTTYRQSFTGKKAVDWLTGVHSRGYHGSGLVATRSEAIALGQKMMDREFFEVATQDETEGRRSDVSQVFIDSAWAYYRFNAGWLAAKSRDSDITWREEKIIRSCIGENRDTATSYCDEVVVELLDAELASKLGSNDDVLPEQLLGSVAIPLRTILQHEASEGWHNLTGPGLQSGEVRIGWLVVKDDGCDDYALGSHCPSPKHHLNVAAGRAAAHAIAHRARATSSETLELLGRMMDATSTQCFEKTNVNDGTYLPGEAPSTPTDGKEVASACCRMAQSFIDVGDLSAAQACLSAGLGLVGPDDHVDLLVMQEHLTRCCKRTGNPNAVEGEQHWVPLFQRQYSGGGYRISRLLQHDRKAPWVSWHSTSHEESGGFHDELGFVVPPAFAHVWRLANSYSLCIAARHRPAWAALIPAGVMTPKRISKWTGWSPGSAEAEAVSDLVMQHGVPPELRQIVWPALLGATARQQQARRGGHPLIYHSLVERYMNEGEHRKQIQKDIHRTLPGQATVVNTPAGALCMERVLGAFSEYDCWYGYTQSLNMVVAHLLVVMSLEAEEEVFWMLAQIVEVVVPEYYSSSLYGMNADAVVLSTLAEHWVGSAHARMHAVGVPMTLVATRWLLPLCAEILPPPTLYRLWDVLFLTRSATPLHAAALTIMRGAHADSFWDFECAMHVLTHGASGAYDAQPFLEHVAAYMSLFSDREMKTQHYQCLVDGYVNAEGIPMVVSPLENLTARLSGLDRALYVAQNCSGYEWDDPVIELDRWQVFRIATPFADRLEYEADGSSDTDFDSTSDQGPSISLAGAIDALRVLLPGLRYRPELVELFVQRVLVCGSAMPGAHGQCDRKTPSRVTLACWLNTMMALQPEANDSPARRNLWWRFCGGGGQGGRMRDGAKGAMMHDIVAAICTVYAALGSPGDDRSFPTERAVGAYVSTFFSERERSWVKRSAIKYGIGRRSTARLIANHGAVFEALIWNSSLCLGVPIPPRKPS